VLGQRRIDLDSYPVSTGRAADRYVGSGFLAAGDATSHRLRRQGVLRWHVNRGWDAAADSVPIADIPRSYRPEVLPFVLQELETTRTLGRVSTAG
jgi:hypothetical protein